MAPIATLSPLQARTSPRPFTPRKQSASARWNTRTPPQPPISFPKSPAELIGRVEEATRRASAMLDEIASLASGHCTFHNVFPAFAQVDATIRNLQPLLFLKLVTPNAELRAASTKASSLLRAFDNGDVKKAVFEVMKEARRDAERSELGLEEEDWRYMDWLIREGERDGLDLGVREREGLRVLKNELGELCAEFSRNTVNERGSIVFSLEELDGVPDDVIEGYVRVDEDEYLVSHSWPDIMPLLKEANDPMTRQLAYISYENRLAVNASLVPRIMVLRKEIADLLGYASWGEYVMEDRMVGGVEGAEQFLRDLEYKLKPFGMSYQERLWDLKRQDCFLKRVPFDGEVWAWDSRYYEAMDVGLSLDWDATEVKDYFPVHGCVTRVLEVLGEVFGLQFEERRTRDVWHDDVRMFAVWNRDAKGTFVGYLYLDVYSRAGKHSKAGVWTLQPGYTRRDGTRSFPSAAVIVNLAKSPQATQVDELKAHVRPPSMCHADLVTFFHEMGHAIHVLVSETRYAKFHGVSVAKDFVEAPSQMFENWCWEPAVLKRVSRHYLTGECLVDAVVDLIVKSRHANSSLHHLRQICKAWFDIRIHTTSHSHEFGEGDYTRLWNGLDSVVALTNNGGYDIPGHGAFSHIVNGGYDCGMYGYLYSLVFAQDMYATAFKADPLDPEAGRRFRETVLKQGGAVDEGGLVKAFLGREPRLDCLLDEMRQL